MVHIAAPTPRCHVAKCSIFVARGPGGLLLFSTSRILAHHRHPGTRFRTHPQHARTHGRRTGSALHCTQFHTRYSLPNAPTARPVSQTPRRISVSPLRAMPHAPLPLFSVFRVPLCARSFSLSHARPVPHAPLPLLSVFRVPLCARSFSLSHERPRTPFPLPVVVLQHAQRLSFSSSGFPPFSWPAVLSFYLQRIAPRATPACMHAYLLARARTTDERTIRRAVRRRG